MAVIGKGLGDARGHFVSNDIEYNDVSELAGFQVAGPCVIAVITERFGPGDFRVTAYGFDPPRVRWGIIVLGVAG